MFDECSTVMTFNCSRETQIYCEEDLRVSMITYSSSTVTRLIVINMKGEVDETTGAVTNRTWGVFIPACLSDHWFGRSIVLHHVSVSQISSFTL